MLMLWHWLILLPSLCYLSFVVQSLSFSKETRCKIWKIIKLKLMLLTSTDQPWDVWTILYVCTNGVFLDAKRNEFRLFNYFNVSFHIVYFCISCWIISFQCSGAKTKFIHLQHFCKWFGFKTPHSLMHQWNIYCGNVCHRSAENQCS